MPKHPTKRNSCVDQLYQDVFEKAPIGIYTLNQKGEIDSFNPTMMKLAGARRLSQVLGLNALKMSSYKKAGLDKFFRQGLKGTAFEVTTDYVSLTSKKKSQRHYQGVPIYDPNGRRVKRLLLIVEDITRHQQIQDELKHSGEKYRTIFELSPEAIVLIDPKGNFIDMNDRLTDWLGYSRKEVIGKNLLKLPFLNKKNKLIAIKNFGLRMAGKNIRPYELEFITHQGEKRLGIILANLIKDEKGKIVADLVMAHDVTERKKIEEMKSEFVSIVSHQLRTPLTGIKWCTELLQNDKTIHLTPKQSGILYQISQNNERMIRLVRDLLNLSRIETGKDFVINKKRTKMTKIIRQILKDNIQATKDKRLKIVINIDPKLSAKVDPEKFDQVWQNLIDNAIKYSKPGKTISFSCQTKKHQTVFSIKDGGIGIPKPEQARVFDKFFRAENATAVDGNGTGLGLHIVKAIVEAHGGTISFKSTENRGSTFYISLPN